MQGRRGSARQARECKAGGPLSSGRKASLVRWRRAPVRQVGHVQPARAVLRRAVRAEDQALLRRRQQPAYRAEQPPRAERRPEHRHVQQRLEVAPVTSEQPLGHSLPRRACKLRLPSPARDHVVVDHRHEACRRGEGGLEAAIVLEVRLPRTSGGVGLPRVLSGRGGRCVRDPRSGGGRSSSRCTSRRQRRGPRRAAWAQMRRPR